MLTPGQRVDVEGELEVVTVDRLLGQGGQGWVFQATGPAGETVALKWYKSAPAPPPPDQWDNLAYLIDRGSPGPAFLWPRGLATAPGVPAFGYVMALRPPSHVGLVCLLLGRDENGQPVDPSFAAVTNLCFQLARNFLKLHAAGLCYRDINYSNVFFDPATGEVLVCDNDNVGVDGSRGSVVGTYGFMAPEVYRLLGGPGVAGAAFPSARTDRHSLAVTLFLALMVAHPLEGAKTETGLVDQASWQLEHFGTDPLFIFDPDDARNRPLSDTAERYWHAYPTFVRTLFTRAFTAGLHDPDARVMESEWAAAMLRLRDAIMSCSACGGTIFWDADDPDRPCIRCGASPERPLFLTIGRKHRIVLGRRTKVWSDHFGDDLDATHVVAEASLHPTDPSRWGLRNLSARTWSATLPSGAIHEVEPGRTIELTAGTCVHFGPADGEVVAG